MLSENRRREVFNITKGKCYYCGCELDFRNFHADHFKAKVLGGKGGKNLVPACLDCNLSKGNLTLEEFRTKISNLVETDHKGRMVAKYYGLEKRRIEFYFEKQGL